MDRRLFLLSTLALASCGGDAAPLTVICDPDLDEPLRRAAAAHGETDLAVSAAGPQDLLALAEAARSALVVTRQALLANRLQRLGFVRLEHRWQIAVDGAPAQMLVTKGPGAAQGRALRFAKWLATDEAAAALSPAATVATAP
ncbi:MAG: hypothetical protein Q8L66_00400 [Caulobacter sp.]|nr:hypothetical protein [Caulobacter sp.]